MDFWENEIEVSLKVKRFRVGGSLKEDLKSYETEKSTKVKKYEVEGVDLDCIPLKYTASSIRGLLKKAVKKAIRSLDLKTTEEEVFGKEDLEGKIQVTVRSSKEEGLKNARYGIKIDPFTGSVKHGHLFSHSFFELEEIRFALRPIVGITKDEAKLLYYGLNYLRYDTIGGFGSRGMGLIEDVQIDGNFRKFVEDSI